MTGAESVSMERGSRADVVEADGIVDRSSSKLPTGIVGADPVAGAGGAQSKGEEPVEEHEA